VKVRRFAVLSVVVAGVVAVAPLALAADTTVTVALAGDLTISAPASLDMGTVSAAAGSTKSATMGTVTVTDGRGSLLGWNVTAVTTTASMSTGGGAPKTIALGTTGPLSWVTGTVTPATGSLPTGVAAGAGGFLSTTSIPVATAAVSAGGGTYTYTPTVALVVPANAEAGTYSVVVRQTVS
jgi:hypothetical protein